MACVKRYEDINLDDFNYTKPVKFNNSYFGQMVLVQIMNLFIFKHQKFVLNQILKKF